MKALIGSLIVAFVAAGCTPAGPGTPTDTRPSAPPTVTPSGTPSVAPTTSPSDPPPTASPTDAESPMPAPPSASLSAAGGEPVDGQLGSVCYLDACGDSPWLPADGLPLVELAGADDELTVAIEDGFEFTTWSAQYAAAEDRTGAAVMTLAEGGSQDGPPLTDATFDPPPSGDWVVSVYLVYADGDGDGAYYWHVTVP